ncbi:protein BIG GRAIN 1-like [Musa acuminata AAA Group]|uniref:protein BIG GRAIN 1-like n=1 Tax=Musa acuminata AAA Group TaxID=214697 RepID=UPI0031E05A55
MEMERWGKERPRRGHENPSFSSTLLDAIYRSMDESDGCGEPNPSVAALASPRLPAPSYRSAAAVSGKAVAPPVRLPPISTSSSSDNSSYGGFSSSSEPESASSHRARFRPIRIGVMAPDRSPSVLRPPPPPPQPAVHHSEKTKSGSIRSNRSDPGRPKAPASPGARLGRFLNALFSAAAKNPKKSKTSTLTVAAAAAVHVGDPACSTASSHSRPCLVKTPSSRRAPGADDEGVKRSVRFHPVNVIMGEDLRPCGQKNVYACDRAAGAGTEIRRRSFATEAAKGKSRDEARRRVEELLRRFEDEEDDMSDASSDLFELENLTVMGAGGGGGGGYRHELPVYETTHPGTNRAISRGIVV